MSTIEAAPETAENEHGHDHDHPSFLAHHFDTPEQQFDSGKLGIWLFLVTEILFFSGMFCAYAIFRMMRPDVFEGCSQFLNTKLGAINTGVLLFSSLSMAWAVRCSQVEDNKGLIGMLSATLSCAMIFLGVKAIEYSHKWGMGLLPAGLYTYDPYNPHPTDHPFYLGYLCAPFALALIGVVVWLIISLLQDNKFHAAIAKPLTVVCLSFFLGVGLGVILESGEAAGEEHAAAAHDDHSHVGETHSDDGHESLTGEDVEAGASDDGHNDHGQNTAAAEPESDAAVVFDDQAILQRLASEETNSGLISELEARERQAAVAGSSVVMADDNDEEDHESTFASVEKNVLTQRTAGVFFSIYYCMTGVHAIHILGGIGVLVWLLVRSVRKDFNKHYFGPVDYVGLYWHLVDLIWIYLFPLLYLIR